MTQIYFKTFLCFRNVRLELARTEHSDLGRLTVSLANHIGTHADVYASIAFPRVGDHQLPSTDLKGDSNVIVSRAINSTLCGAT